MCDINSVAELYSALQPILGLPDQCISFELTMRAGGVGALVVCEHYVAIDAPGIKQLECVFSQYELMHRPAPAADASAEFHVVDCDVWMRDRTERAHREFLERTAKLSTIVVHGARLGRA